MTPADELWYAFQTWRDGVEFTHDRYAPKVGQFVGHVPAHDFRNAEKVLLHYLPDLLGSRCSDNTPAREVAS